jgi:hypothetical protein
MHTHTHTPLHTHTTGLHQRARRQRAARNLRPRRACAAAQRVVPQRTAREEPGVSSAQWCPEGNRDCRICPRNAGNMPNCPRKEFSRKSVEIYIYIDVHTFRIEIRAIRPRNFSPRGADGRLKGKLLTLIRPTPGP